LSQEIVKKCCNNPPAYLITYDCGPEPNSTLLVCKDHYKEEPFHRFAIKVIDLETGKEIEN